LFIQFPSEPGLVPPAGSTRPSPSPPADVLNIPELELVKTVPRGRLFSSFHPAHRAAAYALVRIFKSIFCLLNKCLIKAACL
jgi:hypothetical protein